MPLKPWNLLVFAVILFQIRNILSDPSEVMIDLIVVIQATILGNKSDLDGVKSAMVNLSNFFRFGDNFTRAAIVTCPRLDCEIQLTFTEDDLEFEKAIDDLPEISDTSDSSLRLAFRLVREQILKSSTRPKAAIVFGQDDISDLDQAKEEAKLLQNGNDTWLYLVTTSTRVLQRMDLPASRLYFVNGYSAQQNFSTSIIHKIRADIEDNICEYVQICRYTDGDQNSCTGDLWNPLVQNDFNCSTIKPRPSFELKSCKSIDCDRVCDQMWPRSPRAECGGKCGDLNVTRMGPTPKPFLKHCPTKIVCSCGRGPFVEAEPQSWLETISVILIGVAMLTTIIVIVGVTLYQRKRRMARMKERVEKSRRRRTISKAVISKLGQTPAGPSAEAKPGSPKKPGTASPEVAVAGSKTTRVSGGSSGEVKKSMVKVAKSGLSQKQILKSPPQKVAKETVSLTK